MSLNPKMANHRQRLPWVFVSVWLTLQCASPDAGNSDGRAQQGLRNPPVLPVDVIVPTDVTDGIAAGAVVGNFDITSQGEATYTLPLWTPTSKGSAALNLALSYRDGASDGILGVGWGLQGVSTISRCPSTFVPDGINQAVRFDGTDKYCLDGLRLQLVSAQLAYGADGAEYRTIPDTFVKVISHQPDGLGPTSFTAYYSDGRVATFGGDAATRLSRVEGPRFEGKPATPNAGRTTFQNIGSVRLGWAQSQLEDRVGNAVAFFYSSQGRAGVEHLLTEIQYTFNSKQGAVSDSQRRVVFEYEPRPDVTKHYVSGFRLSRENRLKRIALRGPGVDGRETLLREYGVTYDAREVFTQVASVRECDGAGACVQPTTFEWTKRHGFVGISGPAGSGFQVVRTGDFNGDGCDDLLYFRAAVPPASQGWFVSEAVGCGTGSVSFGSAQYLWNSAPDSVRVFDLNADGADDIIVIDSAPSGQFMRGFVDVVLGGTVRMGSQLCTGLSCRATHLFEAAWDPAHFGLEPAVWFADLDGDGLSEFVFAVEVGGFQVLNFKRNLGTTVDANGDTNPLSFGPVVSLDTLGEGGASIGDLDGDGASDVIYAQLNAPAWFWTGATSFPTGATALRRESGMMNGRVMQRQQYLVDLNGDGLVDLVEAPEAGGDPSIAYNSGNGFEISPIFTTWDVPPNKVSGAWVDNALRVADVDGDGVDEILKMTGPGGRRQGSGLTARSARNGVLETVLVAERGSLGIVSGDETFAGYSGSQVLDVNGDGLMDLVQVEDGALRLYVTEGERRHLVKAVTNGMGERVDVSRMAITARAVVSRTGCAPVGTVTCLTRGRSVVHEIRRSSSAPGQSAVTMFRYDTPVFDVPGRRFVAFQRRVTNLPAGSGTVTETYDLSRVDGYFPFASRPTTVVHDVALSPSRTRRSVANNVYRLHANARPWWVELFVSGSEDFEFDPTVVASPSQKDRVRAISRLFPVYDDFGNALESQFSTDDGWSGKNVLRIPIDAANWYVRAVESVTRTSRAPTGVSRTRVVEKTYANGLVTAVVVDPHGDCDSYLRKTYHRLPDGHVWQMDEEGKMGCGVTPRSTKFEYDPIEGITLQRLTNAEGHETTFAFHRGLGVLGALDDVNGVRTVQHFDGFGRLKRMQRAAAGVMVSEYVRLPSGVRVTTQADDSPPVLNTYDALGRLISSETQAFGKGGDVVARTEYDVLGRPIRRIAPKFDEWVDQPTTFTYDAMGRPTTVVHPDGSHVSFAYERNVVARKDERGFVQRTTFDALGKAVEVAEQLVDPQGSRLVATQYRYGPFRELAEVMDALGTVRHFERDSRGRLLETTDPYAGKTSLRWTPFGELRKTSSAKSELTVERDRLGRLLTRTGKGTLDRFVWDSASNGIGALDREESSDGIAKTRKYDGLGRLTSTTWRFGGDEFTFGYGYDAFGRVEKLQYPTIPGLGRPVVTWTYRKGQLETAKEALSGVEWEAINDDAEGRLVEETLNGLTTTRRFDNRGRIRFISTTGPNAVQSLSLDFDATGNVTSRHDNLARTTEDFSYDSLGRLRRWTVFQQCRKSETEFTYDLVGNLISRTPLPGSGDSSADFTIPGAGTYNPDTANLNGSGVRALVHDDDGRLEAADALKLVFDEQDRLRSAADGLHSVEYLFDVGRELVVRNTKLSKEVDIEGLFRRRDTAKGREYEYFVVAGGRTVAKVSFDGKVSEVASLFRDANGSIDVVERANGGREVKKYEPFGARRFPYSLATNVMPAMSSVREGFVGGYEDALGLVDLGARIYAPSLHRFTSADPLVTAGDSSQGWNRTGYAWNNPVSYVDATGLCPQATSKYETVVCASRMPQSMGFVGSGALSQALSAIPTPGEVATNWDQNARGKTHAYFAQTIDSQASTVEHVGYTLILIPIELGAGLMDLLRLGEGAAEGTMKGVATDVFRAVAIFTGLRGFVRAVRPPPVSAPAPLAVSPAARGVGGGSGPWVPSVVGEGGAVAQTAPGSCGSACAEMLSGGARTQAQVLGEIGEWASAGDVAGALGPGWRAGYFGSGTDALSVAGRGPMGGVLWAPGARAGHMVVIEPGPAGFLIRDPLPGVNYTVGANWIERWVAGGVWK